MLSWGAAIKSFTFFGLNSLEWAGLGITTFIIVYFGLELLNVIYNTWIGQILGSYADLKKMGKWAGRWFISYIKFLNFFKHQWITLHTYVCTLHYIIQWNLIRVSFQHFEKCCKGFLKFSLCIVFVCVIYMWKMWNDDMST